MKTFLINLLLASTSFIFWNCDQEPMSTTCDQGVFATVKDLTGLDGCGFVFELADGSRLEPVQIGFCGTPPLSKEITENPLYNFQFVNGKQVRITFEEVPDAMSICMVGKMVRITCLEEINVTE